MNELETRKNGSVAMLEQDWLVGRSALVVFVLIVLSGSGDLPTIQLEMRPDLVLDKGRFFRQELMELVFCNGRMVFDDLSLQSSGYTGFHLGRGGDIVGGIKSLEHGG